MAFGIITFVSSNDLKTSLLKKQLSSSILLGGMEQKYAQASLGSKELYIVEQGRTNATPLIFGSYRYSQYLSSNNRNKTKAQGVLPIMDINDGNYLWI